ncbi:MAG: hypothetical protein IKM19_00035 [Firmicutes bacterium]|nr:hypothetical protein [Bacillota bacterium]
MITISGIDWFTVCMTSLMVILALCWDIPKLKKMMQHHWFISEKRRRKILMAYAVAVVLLTLIVIGACAQPDTTPKPGVIVEESTFIASSEMGGIESGISSIIYEKYEIKIEALYPYCLEKYMKSNMYGSYRDGYYQSLPETEATMWGVDEVCRLYAKDGTAAYRWVLIDENYFIGVHSDRIEITDEEKQILSEKLELKK